MTKKNLSTAILLLLCVDFSLVGCSREKEADQKAESVKQAEKAEKATGPFEVNACSLMTQQEAEELLNEKMGSPREEQHLEGEITRAAMSSCLFPSESEKSLSIFYRKSPIADNSPESIQALKNTISGEGGAVEEVDGVGNTAFWSNNQLHIFEGDRSYLIITVDGLADEEQSSEAAKKAAEIVLERVA
jgi:hypothetical protein